MAAFIVLWFFVRMLPFFLFVFILWRVLRFLASQSRSGGWSPPPPPGGGGAGGQQRRREPPPSDAYGPASPRDPYQVLGCSPSDTNDEIKKRYRELLTKYHPDKFIGQGYDEEFVRLASRRFQEIQEAYEKIRASRRL